MFKHYLITSYRNLSANPLYFFISVTGLAVALAAALLILLYVQDMLSWDKHWKNKDTLFRVTTTVEDGNGEKTAQRNSAIPIAALIKKNYPDEIIDTFRLYEYHGLNWHIQGDTYSQILVLSDPAILTMLEFETLYGDLKASMADPYKIALSESIALKFFGKTNPVGQTIDMSSRDNANLKYEVAAVYKEFKKKTTIWVPVLAKYDARRVGSSNNIENDWERFHTNQTFLQLKNKDSARTINMGINALIDKNAKHWDASKKYSDVMYSNIDPIEKLHLGPGSFNRIKVPELIAITAVAYLIVLLACVNFVNLTTAKAIIRMKEASIKKVFGASRLNLLTQFLFESSILVGISLFIGMILIEILSPTASSFFGEKIQFNYLNTANYRLLFFLFIASVLVSGIYPSIILSFVRPAKILLSNRSSESKTSTTIRTVLVIFQLTVSMVLIISSAVIFLQVNEGILKNRNSNIANVFEIWIPRELNEKEAKELKEEIRKQAFVNVSTSSYNLPFRQVATFWPFFSEKDSSKKTTPTAFQAVTAGYFSILNPQILSGRLFDSSSSRDLMNENYSPSADSVTSSIIINESALTTFGFVTPEEAIGGKLLNPRSFNSQEGETIHVEKPFEIIGVIKNIEAFSILKKDPPIIYVFNGKWVGGQDPYSPLLFSSSSSLSDIQKSLNRLTRNKGEEDAKTPSVRDAISEAKMSLSELLFISRVLIVKMILVLFIAAIGMLGLTSLSVTKRTKEIGMRKVLGASTAQITRLLLWQFSKPVLIASVLAGLIASAVMVYWLNSFAYTISYWLLLPISIGAAALTLLITLCTVGGIAYKTACMKPSNSLRYQ